MGECHEECDGVDGVAMRGRWFAYNSNNMQAARPEEAQREKGKADRRGGQRLLLLLGLAGSRKEERAMSGDAACVERRSMTLTSPALTFLVPRTFLLRFLRSLRSLREAFSTFLAYPSWRTIRECMRHV